MDDYKFHIHGKPAYGTLFLTQESITLEWKFPIDASCYWSITANWVTTSFYQFSAYSERPTQLNSTQPVLKMFRTSPTGKKLSDFQFFSWVELSGCSELALILIARSRLHFMQRGKTAYYVRGVQLMKLIFVVLYVCHKHWALHGVIKLEYILHLSQFTNEIKLHPFSENGRPPCWTSTSGFDVVLSLIIRVSFCIGTPNFINITPSSTEWWRCIHFFSKMPGLDYPLCRLYHGRGPHRQGPRISCQIFNMLFWRLNVWTFSVGLNVTMTTK